jgi:hypothetical protein
LQAGHIVLTCGPVLTVTGCTPGGAAVLPGDAVSVPIDLDLRWSGTDPRATARAVAGRRRAGDARVV